MRSGASAPPIDGDDLPGAKAALKQTISLIDKMTSKGIIHRNAAGRYKSRLTRRIAAKTERSQRAPALFTPHNSTTSRSSRMRGSPADRFRSRSVRNSASTASGRSRGAMAGNLARTSQPS